MKHTPFPRRIFRLTLFAAFLVFLTFSATALWLCYQQALTLAHPISLTAQTTPDSVGITNWREVSFTTSDGIRLDGWYIPPENGAALVYVHGIGGNRAALLEARFFVENGYGLLMFDLRDCGTSEGDVTSMGYYEALDVQAAYAFLAAQPEVNAIALYGVSMGGAAVIRAMPELPEARALIVESTYASLLSVIGDGVTARTGLPPFPFADIIVWLTGRESGANLFEVNSMTAIAQIDARPVLIMHGTADATIPVHHAQDLYDAAQEPRELWIVEGAGHGGLIVADPEGYAAHVLPFLQTYLLDE